MYHDNLDLINLAESDFEGAANIFILPSDVGKFTDVLNNYSALANSRAGSFFRGGELNIDLIINKADFTYSDRNHLTPNIGNTFYHKFYGKSPMQISFQGVIIDQDNSKGKPEFMEVYTSLLRINMVAKTKIVPRIEFKKFVASCAFLGIQLSEASSSQDFIPFTANVLVFGLSLNNEDNQGPKSLDINYSMFSKEIPVAEGEQDTGTADFLRADRERTETYLASQEEEEEVILVALSEEE